MKGIFRRPEPKMKGVGTFDATGKAVRDEAASRRREEEARLQKRIERAQARLNMRRMGLGKHKGGNGQAMARDKRVPDDVVIDITVGNTVGQLRRKIRLHKTARRKQAEASRRRNRA